jgi:leucyl-tRNA synthetase
MLDLVLVSSVHWKLCLSHTQPLVMGVPAHDERDRAFASALGISQRLAVLDAAEHVYVGSGSLRGRARHAAAASVCDWLVARTRGGAQREYRLRDWLVSRQRSWGAPVPMVHCAACGVVPVPSTQLPVLHAPPRHASHAVGGNARFDEWRRTRCPQCHGDALREGDTMDTFVDSAWYWLRFADPHCTSALARAERARAVDVYVGGIEHAVLHLLYARFVARALHSVGLCPSPEPFARLVTQGMIVGRTYRRARGGRPVAAADVRVLPDGSAVEASTGEALVESWEKMSKSKHNGIDPRDIVATHGADCARLYVLFKAPIALELAWDEAQVRGQSRFLARVWRLGVAVCAMKFDHVPTSSRSRAAVELLKDTGE